ncbi:MAG: fasciclin domain-containing protein [Flavobacteriales bacterium]
MNKKLLTTPLRKIALSAMLAFAVLGLHAQTNVWDDIISTSPDHTSLAAAIQQANIQGALINGSALTVFAPDNDAFAQLAADLDTDIPGLLASPSLTDILFYHVLELEAPSSSLINGQIVQPINASFNVKLTVTGEGDVFANQAQVIAADLTADNGVVHSISSVLFPQANVVDVAMSTGEHTVLTTAVIEAELLPALTDPFAEFTLFAPTDDAFTAALGELDLTAIELLESDGLADILTYHVLGSTVLSTDLMNGMTPTPLNDANTIKVTLGDSGVFVNQAEVTVADNETGNGVVHVTDGVILATETVVDVALGTGVHGTLVAAVIEAELLPALTNPFAELTVFAPTDDAFVAALGELGLTAEELLASDGLADILTYHVLGSTVLSTDLMNGMTPTPLNDANTIKVTLGDSGVFVNQAEVTGADNETGNGVVHVTNGVILPTETVVDVALGTGVHGTLVAAVIEAELLPALTNPFAELTVFAPTDDAFVAALGELGLTAEELLASDGLADILTYHVLGSTVLSTDLMNGMTPTPLNDANTIKVTLGDSGVFVNQAEVTGADNETGNGVVHVTDAVILANETIADTVIDSDEHTVLELALIEAELLPAVTNPFTELTLFAPTDAAFTVALAQLQITAAELLADDGLSDILLYHVVAGTVLSTDLANGNVETLSGEDVIVNIDMGAMINNASVTGADVTSSNGVVHVIDAVLLSTYLSVEENDLAGYSLSVYPNPSSDFITVNTSNSDFTFVRMLDTQGRVVFAKNIQSNQTVLDVSSLSAGQYVISLIGEQAVISERVVVQ